MENPDFVSVLTWDKDLYELLGKQNSFENYDKSLVKPRNKVDRSEQFKTKYFEKLNRAYSKNTLHFGEEVKNSVLSQNVK